jgi:hypothetical protein
LAAATGCAIFRFDCRPLILYDLPLGHHLMSVNQRTP